MDNQNANTVLGMSVETTYKHLSKNYHIETNVHKFSQSLFTLPHNITVIGGYFLYFKT